MADRAVGIGSRVGVVATLPTTLEPTADLIRRRASAAGKSVEVVARLCEGAFEALMGGDAASHDERVASALRALGGQVDVVVLAQASIFSPWMNVSGSVLANQWRRRSVG